MYRLFTSFLLIASWLFAHPLMGQEDNTIYPIAGYQKLIASGGDYDTLSAPTLERLPYKANASYYGSKLVVENFAKSHLLAMCAYRQQEFSEAILYAHLALRWAAKIGDDNRKASSFRILSDIYNKQNRYDSALHCKTKALIIYRQLRNHTLANVMNYQIGNLYFNVNDYDRARVFFRRLFAKRYAL